MKHIVCIIDGTWQTPTNVSATENFSNAYSLNWMLDNRSDDGSEQVVFYFSGLGSDKKSQPYTAGAFARGIDHQIAEVYINIASNFRSGPAGDDPDRIYIFGFSRGAVAARAVAGMISSCGLLRPSRMDQYPAVWRAFVANSPIPPGLARFCHSDVAIDFVGVFDTVFGDYRMSSQFSDLKFPNLDLPARVRTGVHILALDETRMFFSPMLWEGHNAETQHLEQIWMPGVHSDVGGVYGSRFLGVRALKAMLDRVSAYTPLKFNKASVAVHDALLSDGITKPEVNDELAGRWRYLPRRRRKASARFSNQYLHELAEKMDGFELPIRGRRRTYDYSRFCQTYRPETFRNWTGPIAWW